ncbi:hypothetical protein ACFY2Z_24565 [Streptomyces sp. NPDC001222]|uniref:hypothetical protein n=1 Tax=Streptomyces sp. NPDC001222 TaxID=3364548 RepID=UPI00369C6C47
MNHAEPYDDYDEFEDPDDAPACAGELPVPGGLRVLEILGGTASGEGETDHGRWDSQRVGMERVAGVMWRSVLPRMGEKSQRGSRLGVAGLGTWLPWLGNQGLEKVQESGSDGLGHVERLVRKNHLDLL